MAQSEGTGRELQQGTEDRIRDAEDPQPLLPSLPVVEDLSMYSALSCNDYDAQACPPCTLSPICSRLMEPAIAASLPASCIDTPPSITSFTASCLNSFVYLPYGILSILTPPLSYFTLTFGAHFFQLTSKRRVEESPDPLWTASRLAIAGNVIDFGIFTSVDIEGTVERALKGPIAIDYYPASKDKIKKHDKILYLLDNADEIVFDRILIETLVSHGKKS